MVGGIGAPDEKATTIFPNPSRDFVRFAGLDAAATIEVFSMQGVLLYTYRLEQDGWLDVRHLPRGLVYVRWHSQQGKV